MTILESQTIFGLRMLMVLVPSIITVLGFIIYVKGYKIHGEYQEKIDEELNRNRLNEEVIA